MDLTEPARALLPGLTAPLLRALTTRGTPATAEQLRRTAGTGTPAGIRRALDRLAEHGIVEAEQVGERTTVYELNRNHLLFPAIPALLGVNDTLAERLSATMASWTTEPRCAALFGSAARRTGDSTSDIDLLLIRPPTHPTDVWDDQIHQLREQVQRWTGNHLQVFDRSADQLRQLVATGEAIVDEWERDAITLHGPDLHLLLNDLR